MIYPLPAFGSIEYFSHLAQETGTAQFATNEVVDRKNKRNRYNTVDNKGIKLNSIPICKPRDRKPLSEVHIANEEEWQRDHWRSLVTNYNNSPFFEFYDYKFELLFNKKFNSLLDFNRTALEITLAILKINVQIVYMEKPHDAIELKKANSFKEYQQVFALPFQENTSILDLIFNLGPDAKDYLAAVAFGSE